MLGTLMLNTRNYIEILRVIKVSQIEATNGYRFVLPEKLISNLIDYFKQDNPRFNEEKFREEAIRNEV